MDTLNFFRQSMAESDSVKSFIPGSTFHLDLPAARNLVRVFYELWQTTERRTIEMVNAGKSTREQVLLLSEQNDAIRAKLAAAPPPSVCAAWAANGRPSAAVLEALGKQMTADDYEDVCQARVDLSLAIQAERAERAAMAAARESAAMYGTRISGGAGRLGS